MIEKTSPEVQQAYESIERIMPWGNLEAVLDTLLSLELNVINKYILPACPKCGVSLESYVPLSLKVMKMIESGNVPS